MATDLTGYQKGDLLQHPNKQLFIVLENKQVTVNKVSLYDIKNGKELEYQVESQRPITVESNMTIIKPEMAISNVATEFKKITLEDAEEFILSPQDVSVVRTLLSRINNPKEFDEFIARK